MFPLSHAFHSYVLGYLEFEPDNPIGKSAGKSVLHKGCQGGTGQHYIGLGAIIQALANPLNPAFSVSVVKRVPG